MISRNKIFVHLGSIENTDICVLIADFFMRFNLITWSVVSGIHNDKLIIVVRNDGTRKDAGTLMHNKFGKFGSAGGHRSMARAEAQISLLSDQTDINDPEKLLTWIISQFENSPRHEKKRKK